MYCASRSPHRIDVEFIYQGLHEYPGKLQKELFKALGRVEEGSCDYVLFNYGVCGNGTLGITHQKTLIIIHNVHDCIPLLLRNSDLYGQYIADRPATFFFSCGWIEGFPLPVGEDYRQKYREFYGREINALQRDSIDSWMESGTGTIMCSWNQEKNYSLIPSEVHCTLSEVRPPQ
jgi:hypothetical protein